MRPATPRVEGKLIPHGKLGRLPICASSPACSANSTVSKLDDILTDPAPLLAKLAEIAEAQKPPPPKHLSTHRLPRSGNAFVAREHELAQLDRAWAEQQPNLLALIAHGGAGKTALAAQFLHRMEGRAWASAEAVFAFSFDSQGTDDKRQGSSDRFFAEALDFFGEDPAQYDQDPAAARKRAARLSEILRQRRVLLILDGIEPMQRPDANPAENGRLRDDSLYQFLNDIARDSQGLCVVTSRLPLPDFYDRPETQVRQIDLPNLPLADAVEILRGEPFHIRFPQAQLEDLCRRYGHEANEIADGQTKGAARCHAKAIALIGGYLAKRFDLTLVTAPTDAELRDSFEMPDAAFQRALFGREDPDLAEKPGYSTYKMTRRYEILYEDQAQKSGGNDLLRSEAGRQLALMRIMGLFDRPAPWAAFQAVLAAPEIPGLTDGLAALNPSDLQIAVTALRRDGLLNPNPDGGAILTNDHLLDAHPLIRDYFSKRLHTSAPDAFREAHRRLYDFYRYDGLPEAFREPVAYGLLGIGPLSHNELQEATFLNARMRTDGFSDFQSGRGHPKPCSGNRRPTPHQTAALIDTPAWQEALQRFLPPTETGMLPLFAAIAHGCAAGRQADAFSEVYRPRIARGDEWLRDSKTRPLRLRPQRPGAVLRPALRHPVPGPLRKPTKR